MAKAQLRTFGDIVTAIMEQLKYQSTDTVNRNRIKRNINMVWQDEIVPYSRWQWLRKVRTLQTEPTYATGTASVTQNLTTVTLSDPPSNSKRGHYFSALNSGNTYKIASHVAGSSTFQLETPYTEATGINYGFSIWTDLVPLPADCKEVVEVSGDHLSRPLENLGLQEFRRLSAPQQRAEGRPMYYTTSNFEDPNPYGGIAGLPAVVSRSSSGLIKSLQFEADVSTLLTPGDSIEVSGSDNYTYNIPAVVSSVTGTSITYTGTVPLNETTVAQANVSVSALSTASYNSFKNLMVYPAASRYRSILKVDYQLNVEALEFDSDEPLIPVEDRIVLFYGGMAMSCDRERNPEWAMQNEQKFQAKLARMAGKTGDSPEKPMLAVSGLYLRGKMGRGGSTGLRGLSPFYGQVGGVGGGSPTITGRANSVAIFDENGELVGSADIDLSALEFLVGAQGGLSASLPASSTTDVNAWSATTYKGIQIYYQINRGSTFESGTFYASTNGSDISYGTAGTWGIGNTGVDLVADIFAGTIRVQSITDGSGPTAIISYKAILL